MLFLLPALAAFTGKLSGGFLADWLGARPTATIALALSAPLLAFGNTSVILSCIGLILFNTTTAVTLGAIAAQLPRHPGFGFGLTTLGLFIGSTFSFFWALPEYLRPSLTLVLIAISAIFILLAVPGKAIRKPEAAKKTSGNARIKTRQ
jgi:MFS family permease